MSLYKKDSEQALKIAQQTVTRLPEGDENVINSYVLESWIYGDHKSYAELIRKHARPYLILNATDMTLGTRFEFTQDSIGTCSDVRPGHSCGVSFDNLVVKIDEGRALVAVPELIAGAAASFSSALLADDEEASRPESVSRRRRFKSV